MTVKEIAASEGVSERQVQRYISEGYKGRHKLPATKHRKAFHIAVDDYKAWRIACGFDVEASSAHPADSTTAKTTVAAAAEVPASPEDARPYPPYPQAADPNGIITNAPHAHSRNWPHPDAYREHVEEAARKMKAQLRGYSDEE